MRNRTAAKVDEGGNLIIPEEFRQRHGLDGDAQVVVESREEGLLLRPLSSLSRHTYSDERRAEFLLSNASDDEEYRRAVETVRAMGLDPEHVPHERPPGAGRKRSARAGRKRALA